MTKLKYVRWFNEVDKDDIGTVGGKGANLGEMTKAGFPVPNGFVLTAQAYFQFLEESGLTDDLHRILGGLDVNNSDKLAKASKDIEHKITHARFPQEIATEVINAYLSLDKGKNVLVAVRSSATAEDLPTASFAGQQATFLNVTGEANLLEKIKEAWASLFTARAIFYRVTNKFDHFKVGIAIPVQIMVQSEFSGIMFTLDPVTNDKSKIVVDAIIGLGEMIVQGAVTPDHFKIDKKEKKIIEKEVNIQEKVMRRDGTKTHIVVLSPKEGSKQKISDEMVLKIAAVGEKLEKHYYFPQDIEWSVEKDKVYIVQTRPVTTTGIKNTVAVLTDATKRELLVKGDAASPGMAAGPVKVISGPKEIGKIVKGDILVALMTNPDYVPAMKKAVAIITERGGRTSHAAIVSRELGIPAVVGAKGIMQAVKDGMVITANGSTGEVYKGTVVSNEVRHPVTLTHAKEKIKTATKLYVNLAEPERAKEVATMDVDGIGLLRAEFMMAGIGTHPKKFIEDKKQSQFIEQMALGMETICEPLYPRPVVYRASDFRTNEFRNLKGGDRYEPVEDNPMLGFRGAARYIADPRVFSLELEAIKKVRNKRNLKNLHLMIPFVRSPKELMAVKKIVSASGLSRSGTFKLWMMVELPTNVINIEEFLDVGIDGISFGSNDLTMLVLGTDRDNSEIASAYNEIDPSLLWCYQRVINACNKRGVTTSMCGQAPSDYPELVAKLVEWGVTSMSVNRDVAVSVRHSIASAEHELIRKRSR
ncbi:MAG: phosphoenolpyruvate synthase [Patescibacteria group bacterium]